MKPKDVICLKNGVTSVNDYNWNLKDIIDYVAFGIKESKEWDANRARGLEMLIEAVKANPDDWSQFKVTHSDSLNRDVLHVVEKQNGVDYAFYVAYGQDVEGVSKYGTADV